MSKIVEVAAVILLRAGRHGPEYLLAQRPAGKVFAGYWEFPGGKVEAGESFLDAARRELQEELGIAIDRAWPWICREFSYPHARVRLKFFRVHSWQGEITPIEHSGLCWTRLGEAPDVSPILPANGPILRALELPPIYALTHAEANGVDTELSRLDTALQNGLRLIQVRDKTLPADERQRLAEGVMALTRSYPEAQVLVNDDEALAQAVGAHGLHLSSAALRQCARRPPFERVAASCHSAEELAHAAMLELDFAVLSPLLPTPSHPGVPGMGWDTFAALIEQAPLPVFALGGMQPSMLDEARTYGAHGIALLRGWQETTGGR